MSVSLRFPWQSGRYCGVVLAYILDVALHSVMAGTPTYYMADYCSSNLDMGVAKVSAGRLLLHRHDQPIQELDCHLSIRAPANQMVTFRFQQFDVKSPHGCANNYLQIFGDTNRQHPLTEKLCNSNPPKGAYVTSGQDAALHLWKEQIQGDNFELTFTVFRFAPCSSSEYQCDNGHCIASHLYCNGVDNCGDRSDICLLRKETIIGIVAVATVVVFISVVVVTLCLIRRQRKIRLEKNCTDGTTLQLEET